MAKKKTNKLLETDREAVGRRLQGGTSKREYKEFRTVKTYVPNTKKKKTK